MTIDELNLKMDKLMAGVQLLNDVKAAHVARITALMHENENQRQTIIGLERKLKQAQNEAEDVAEVLCKIIDAIPPDMLPNQEVSGD